MQRVARAEELVGERDVLLGRLTELGLPVFVKPARLGSSVGITRVRGEHELVPALEAAVNDASRRRTSGLPDAALASGSGFPARGLDQAPRRRLPQSLAGVHLTLGFRNG